MTPTDYKLHELLMRHFTGMLGAYKNWLDKQVVENPDPIAALKGEIKEQEPRAE